ncbi:uncharacterized protein [Mytilus edulis]|uniref:uncharacterized protein n=1 Tax=Mytilus edulis TaxID=6550 RepID=UPI0039EEF6AF
MDTTDQNTSLDDFLTWKVSALREYLTKRGMTKDGTKSELAALCYSASVLKIEVVPSSFEIIKNNKLDYQNLLKINGQILSDPLQIHDNWLDEKNGMKKFPPVYISDIIKYLSEKNTSGKMKEILQDYKIGKAYEYFKNGFLQEIFYHDIDARSKYCFLRAKCVPSQKIKDEEHDVWVCVEKATGEIGSSYCTCTAGLGGTCNHVAGLLFRVEAANKLGASACTSLPCTWKVPSKIKGVKPTKIKDLRIIKSRHGQSDSKRPLVSQSKSQYQPIPESKDNLDIFSAVLKKSIPNACIFKGFVTENVEQTVTKPVSEDITAYTIQDIKTKCNEQTNFLSNMPKYNESEIQKVMLSTIGQSSKEKWHEIRSGRLTSSNFYEIHTKVQSYKKKEGVTFDLLISRLMGYKKLNPNIRSLKHGREMEPEAKLCYLAGMKKAGHTNVNITECGIFLDKDITYLGASPDVLVDCACCGSGVVEIKCPLVQKCGKRTTICSCCVPDYLYVDETRYSLKKKTQILWPNSRPVSNNWKEIL